MYSNKKPALDSPPIFKDSWDPVIHILDGQSNSVCCCAYSHDGKLLASGSDDGTINLLDTVSGNVQRTFQAFLDTAVCSIALSRTGYMAASSRDIFQVWEISTGEKIKLKYEEFFNEGKKIVSFSEDGRMLVVSRGNTLFVWSVPTFYLILRDVISKDEAVISKDEAFFIDSVKFSKDGTRMAVMLRNHERIQINIRKLNAYKQKNGIVAPSMSSEKQLLLDTTNDDWANEIAFSPDSKYVAIARGTAQKMCIWDWESEDTPKILNEDTTKEATVSFSPDGLFLASGSRDKSVKMWRKPWNAKHPAIVLKGHSLGVRGLSFSPTETRIATCSSDGTIRVWDYDSLKAHA